MTPVMQEPATAPIAARAGAPVLARQTLVVPPRVGGRRVAQAGAAAMLLCCIDDYRRMRGGAPARPRRWYRLAPGVMPEVPFHAEPATAPMPPPPSLPPAPTAVAGPAAAALAPDAPPLAPPALGPGMRRLVLTLGQLGAGGPMTMRGTSEIQGVLFGVRTDEVVVGAELMLSGAVSPALIPEYSNVTVTLNEQYVGTIPADHEHPVFGPLPMPINPVFFQDNNRLNFRFTGRYTNDCNDPLSGLLWATVSDTSTLTLTLARLPAQRDLARLPLPFFDRHEGQRLALPFVLPSVPGNKTLQAAAASSVPGSASWRASAARLSL